MPLRSDWKIVETSRSSRRVTALVYLWRQANIIFIGLTYLALLYAALGPADLLRDDHLYICLWYVAFVCRTAIFHLGLLSLVVVGSAVCLRQMRLVICAIPLLMCTLLPSALATLQPISSELQPYDVRVMSYNAYWYNANAGSAIAEINRYTPDVVVIQECPPVWQRDLPIKLGSQYPYTHIGQRRGSYSSAILSKFPILGQPELYTGHQRKSLPAVRMTIDVRGREVALYNVHLFRPILGRLRKMRRQLRVLRERVADESMPVIVAGDFNFTGLSKMHEYMLSAGLTDAHDAVGQGRGTTWPKTSSINWLPGFRIDHVYTSQAFTPTATRIGYGAGSDHRPLIVDLKLE